jgi:hypothetical protein
VRAARVLVGVLVAALAAGCVVRRVAPGAPVPADAWVNVGGVRVAVRGTGRTHGVVAEVLVEAGTRGGTLPAGTVLEAGDAATWQRYVLSAVLDLAAPGPVAAHGLCLDADRAAWPAGRWMPGVRFLPAETWAADVPAAAPAHARDRRLVALRAVTGPAFEAATDDPRWEPPPIPDAEDVVRQWALWGGLGERTRSDLEATVDREVPTMPTEERAALADAVWTQAEVVLEVGGKRAAEEADVDWSALDLTLKP